MTNVKNYTDDQILDKIESLSTFKGWKVGKYECWIRSTEDETNKFDDKVYSYQVTEEGKRPKFISVHTGTSHSGINGLLSYDTKYNLKRCAVLKSDWMVYDSHKFGLHRNLYEAYRQCKPWPYYEDIDKDGKAEEDGKLVEGEVIYANMHKAGKSSIDINGNSIACLVRNVEADYNSWMKYMNKDKYVTGIILKEW
jgi:hypothetical protein